MGGKVERPPRPVLRYHGGKYRLAPKIIAHFPPHRVYVEPFGGAGSVLMAKPRSKGEVYNDIDSAVVNVFRVLRDPSGSAELCRLLELTPWAREEFLGSYYPAPDPLESARRIILRSFMAHGSSGPRLGMTGFRAKNYARNQTGGNDWASYPRAIAWFCERLRGVTIENRDAIEIIGQQDSPETLFYCDPPYPEETRSALRGHGRCGRGYAHDMLNVEDHRRLAASLHGIAGMAIVSGYACPLYDEELYTDWERVEIDAMADGGRRRVEVLWVNPAASRAGRPLFHSHDQALSPAATAAQARR